MLTPSLLSRPPPPLPFLPPPRPTIAGQAVSAHRALTWGRSDLSQEKVESVASSCVYSGCTSQAPGSLCVPAPGHARGRSKPAALLSDDSQENSQRTSEGSVLFPSVNDRRGRSDRPGPLTGSQPGHEAQRTWDEGRELGSRPAAESPIAFILTAHGLCLSSGRITGLPHVGNKSSCISHTPSLCPAPPGRMAIDGPHGRGGSLSREHPCLSPRDAQDLERGTRSPCTVAVSFPQNKYIDI